MSDKIYVVTSHDEWDSWDIGYFKTKKGAYKWIMQLKYEQWMLHRYINEYSYGVMDYYVDEKELND